MPVHILIARRSHHADFFDSALERFFGDDLEDRLGKPIAVNQGKHGLLDRIRGRILPSAAAGCRDHGLGDFHRACAPETLGSLTVVLGPLSVANPAWHCPRPFRLSARYAASNSTIVGA
jgi:hypothetical protein